LGGFAKQPPYPEAISAYRLLALLAVNAARAEMDRMAGLTHEPDPRHIQAADLLDAAQALLMCAE
jgi:hypothetical protein